MGILSTLRFITSHPLNRHNKIQSIIRFVRWQINIRLNPYPVIYPFTEKSKLIIKRGMTGATGNLYCGLHEYNDMFFMLHFLRREDTFVDIGANVGSYTILASKHTEANTISIEPAPSTYECVLDNLNINRINDKVIALNIALGSEKGTVHFTQVFDTMNHVAYKNEENTIEVPINTLDNVLANGVNPLLLKIDVEGFETNVIAGADKTLQNENLQAIIIELNGSGAEYGFDEKEIHNTLLARGFTPYSYNPPKRELTAIEHFGTLNTIYIRDINFVTNRVKNAPTVKIRNQEI